MYVGEGEAVLRDTFRRARLASPAIIFLDEADALAPRRQEGAGGEQGAGGPDAGLRLLSTLLTEIDGLEETQGGCHPVTRPKLVGWVKMQMAAKPETPVVRIDVSPAHRHRWW